MFPEFLSFLAEVVWSNAGRKRKEHFVRERGKEKTSDKFAVLDEREVERERESKEQKRMS